MGAGITVVPGVGFTSATATVASWASDRSAFVTFTTSTTIPSSPYLMFTLTFGGSWATTFGDAPVLAVSACANPNNARSAAAMAAVAALGPFYVIPNSLFTTAAVYCTNAPSSSTAYDLGCFAMQGP